LATAERAQDVPDQVSFDEGIPITQAAPGNLRMVSTAQEPSTVTSSSSEADSSSQAAATTPKSIEVHTTTPPSQETDNRMTMMSGELSSPTNFTEVSIDTDTSLNPPSIANAPTSPTDCAIVKLHSSPGLEQVEPAVIPELQPPQLIQTPLSVSLTHESKRTIPNSQREKFVVSAQGHRQLLHHQGIDDVSSLQPSIDLQPHPSTKTDFPTIHRQKSFWMGYGASHNKFTSFGLHTKRRHLTIFWQFSFALHMQKNQRHDSHQLNLDAISSSIANADAVRTYHRVFDDIPDTVKKKKYQVGLNFVSTSGNTTLPVATLKQGSTQHDHEQARVARESTEKTTPHHFSHKTSEVSAVCPTCAASNPSKHFSKAVKSLRSKEPPDKDSHHHHTAFQNAIDSNVANTSSIASRTVTIEPSLQPTPMKRFTLRITRSARR
jgi:hypothetical protein